MILPSGMYVCFFHPGPIVVFGCVCFGFAVACRMSTYNLKVLFSGSLEAWWGWQTCRTWGGCLFVDGDVPTGVLVGARGSGGGFWIEKKCGSRFISGERCHSLEMGSNC